MSETVDNEVYLPSQYHVNEIRDAANATRNHLMPAVKEAEEENNE